MIPHSRKDSLGTTQLSKAEVAFIFKLYQKGGGEEGGREREGEKGEERGRGRRGTRREGEEGWKQKRP